MSIHSYKDLDVWTRAVDLAADADALTDQLLQARKYAMANQLSRAALSISSNIAEGNGRVSTAEYAHHVSISRGSLLEVESILHVAIRARRLGQSECEAAFALIEVVGRMLTNLLKALHRRLRSGQQRSGSSHTAAQGSVGQKPKLPPHS